VLRLRRHVRRQERRDLERDARRQVPSDRASGRDVCTASTARACCRSAGASRRAVAGVRTAHLAEILASRESGPASRGARRELANAQLPREPGERHETIRAKRRASSPRCRTGRSCAEAGRAIKADRMHRLDEYLVRFEDGGDGRRRTACTWARDAAEANASCSTSRARTASARWSRSSR
jgi:hypothetical protein